MSRPTLVVVTGPPASGKSTIARELARELGMPFVSKDDLKERLYETFGSDDELQPAIDGAALAILFSVARGNLDAGVDVLVESNFDAETDTSLFRDLGARVVQIHCGGDPGRLVSAFAERARNGRRHPGHEDEPADAGEVRRKIEAGCWDPLDLPGELIEVDVTGGRVDPADLAARLR